MPETNVSISESAVRKFQQVWKKITQDQHYEILKTPEDIKRLGLVPYFIIRDQWVYAKNVVREAVWDIAELLRQEVGRDRFAASTVVEIIRDEIKSHFLEEEVCSFDRHLENVLLAVKSRDHRRQHVRIVAGLELKDIDRISHGCWTIEAFSENHVKEFSTRDESSDHWRENLEGFLRKEYLGKTCIAIDSQGDPFQSRLIADRVATYVINCLRLFSSIQASPQNLQHAIEINLDSVDHGRTVCCSFDMDNKRHGIRLDSTSFRQKYVLTAKSFQVLRESWNAERLWSLIEKQQRSELEDSLVTAITWFGDAQHEVDKLVAYVKYWTALEALVTGHEGRRLVFRLKTAIPILISQTSKEVPSRTRVEKAYNIRSQIVHRGSRVELPLSALNELCNWTWQCILTTAHLLTLGYSTREQAERQAAKIARAKSPITAFTYLLYFSSDTLKSFVRWVRRVV